MLLKEKLKSNKSKNQHTARAHSYSNLRRNCRISNGKKIVLQEVAPYWTACTRNIGSIKYNYGFSLKKKGLYL